MEVFLEGLFETGLTNQRVHGVAFFLVLFPFAGGHTAKVAQNVSTVLGVVLANGGLFDQQTGRIQLQKGRQVGVGNVFQEGIGRQIGDTAKVKFVTETDDRTGILVRPFCRDLVAGAQLIHQQRCSNVRVQTDIHHVVGEVVLPRGVKAGQGIFKGTAHADREVVVPGNAQFPALQHQFVQGFVGLAITLDNVMVENQVIRRSVTHQNVTVPVQNIAAGRTDRGNGGVDLGVVRVAVGLDDLQNKQSSRVKHQNKGKQSKEQPCSESAYSFHVFPPIRPILQIRG